jgi:hypothetical protein
VRQVSSRVYPAGARFRPISHAKATTLSTHAGSVQTVGVQLPALRGAGPSPGGTNLTPRGTSLAIWLQRWKAEVAVVGKCESRQQQKMKKGKGNKERSQKEHGRTLRFRDGRGGFTPC